MPHGAQRTEREEAIDFLQSPSRASLNSVRSFTRPHLLKVTALTMTFGLWSQGTLEILTQNIVLCIRCPSAQWSCAIIESDDLTMSPSVLQGASASPSPFVHCAQQPLTPTISTVHPSILQCRGQSSTTGPCCITLLYTQGKKNRRKGAFVF